MYMQEPWFGLVAAGRKTVEGRAAPPGRWRCGEVIEIRLSPISDRTAATSKKQLSPTSSRTAETCRVRIVGLRYYSTLEEYLAAEWQQAAPQCATKEEALAAYLAVRLPDGTPVFGEERVRQRGGMTAIELVRLSRGDATTVQS